MSVISNYGELKAAVVDWAKRTDLGSQLDNFIQAAHIKIVEYVGPVDQMVDDTDTNKYLDYSYLPYLYGALAEVGKYTRDPEMVSMYTSLFLAELANMTTTGFDVIAPTPSQYPY